MFTDTFVAASSVTQQHSSPMLIRCSEDKPKDQILAYFCCCAMRRTWGGETQNLEMKHRRGAARVTHVSRAPDVSAATLPGIDKHRTKASAIHIRWCTVIKWETSSSHNISSYLLKILKKRSERCTRRSQLKVKGLMFSVFSLFSNVQMDGITLDRTIFKGEKMSYLHNCHCKI